LLGFAMIVDALDTIDSRDLQTNREGIIVHLRMTIGLLSAMAGILKD
jgi:hypothetical protein